MLLRSLLPFLLIALLSSSCATFGSQENEPHIEKGPLYANPCIVHGPSESLVCANPVNGSGVIALSMASGYVCYSPADHEKIIRALILNE